MNGAADPFVQVIRRHSIIVTIFWTCSTLFEIFMAGVECPLSDLASDNGLGRIHRLTPNDVSDGISDPPTTKVCHCPEPRHINFRHLSGCQ